MEANQKESEDILVTFLQEHIYQPLESIQRQKLDRIEKGIDDAVTDNEYVQAINSKLDSLIAEHNTIKTDLGETQKKLSVLSENFEVKMGELNTLGESHAQLINETKANTSSSIEKIAETLSQFDGAEKSRTDTIMKLVEQKTGTIVEEVKTGKDYVVETLGTKILETSEKVTSAVSAESEKVSAKISEETAQLSEKSENGFSELSEKLATQKDEHITSLQTQDNLIQTQAENTTNLLEKQYKQMFGFQKKHSQLIVGLLIAQFIQMSLIVFLLIR